MFNREQCLQLFDILTVISNEREFCSSDKFKAKGGDEVLDKQLKMIRTGLCQNYAHALISTGNENVVFVNDVDMK